MMGRTQEFDQSLLHASQSFLRLELAAQNGMDCPVICPGYVRIMIPRNSRWPGYPLRKACLSEGVCLRHRLQQIRIVIKARESGKIAVLNGAAFLYLGAG